MSGPPSSRSDSLPNSGANVGISGTYYTSTKPTRGIGYDVYINLSPPAITGCPTRFWAADIILCSRRSFNLVAIFSRSLSHLFQP